MNIINKFINCLYYVRAKMFDCFFLFRCSSNTSVNDSALLLCNNVTKVIGEVCHRTNQVYIYI